MSPDAKPVHHLHSTPTPKHTPWGAPRRSQEIARGLIFFDCPGHGGYWLAKERERARIDRFPWFKTFSGGPWYEENCDWSVVALTFPENFSDDAIRGAVRTVRAYSTRATYRLPSSGWKCVIEWMLGNSPEATAIIQRADAWSEKIKHLWERGSMWTATRGCYPRGTWGVTFHRAADGAQRTVYMEYPADRYYSDEALDALVVEPLQVAAG